VADRQATIWVAMRCGQSRSNLTARFAQQESSWLLSEVTAASRAAAVAEGLLNVSGSFGIAPGYTGCSSCGAKSFVQCGRCQRLSCYAGTGNFTCGWCGNVGSITYTIEAMKALDKG
jgi:hypothetical protein